MKKLITKTILILEDDLKTLSIILDKLAKLEEDQSFYFSLVILTDYIQVEDYVNSNPKAKFDIILLDRDCKLGGSLHVLDLERFGADKVISISSVPEWNQEAQKRGVRRVVLKDYQHLNDFSDQVIEQMRELL
ncbi:MAG: hypothetical protein ACD_37C00244G0001 [uncultured bacterium]|nr:MAG: hypothetical protein ACD_37C00244G0001 [uncultured bacterium]